jgi:large subunit ribosomal protein L15
VIEEPNHFGHDAFNSLNRNVVNTWLNVRDLDSVFAKHGKADDTGKVILDLTSLGYDKLLGGGKITGAYTIKVEKVSEGAKAKITAAGGEVISDEHDSE